MKKLINKLKIPILAGAFVLFSASDPNKNKAKDIKVLPSSGTEYRLSRRKAKKRIRELAKTAYEEDAWIYHNGVLTDVGINIAKDNADLDLSEIFSGEFNPKKNFYFSHIHPLKMWGEEIEPVSGPDFFSDELIRNIVDSKVKKIKSEVFDASGEWTYNSNKALKKLYPYSDPSRRSKIKNLVYSAYEESFTENERTKKGIRKFVKELKNFGLKIKYKKLE